MTTEAVVDIGAARTRKENLARRNWGRWGGDDERGTLNLLGPAEVTAAAVEKPGTKPATHRAYVTRTRYRMRRK